MEIQDGVGASCHQLTMEPACLSRLGFGRQENPTPLAASRHCHTQVGRAWGRRDQLEDREPGDQGQGGSRPSDDRAARAQATMSRSCLPCIAG
jgi:hypothetical protein